MAGPLKTHFQRTGGQQWIDSFYRFGAPVGNVFYVSSTASTSSSTGPGYSPETAFTTIDAAIGACVADNGDVIVVEQGHVETVTAAAGVAADVAGVTILGLGTGRQRPKINYTTAIGASVDITAARVTFDNIVFTGTGFDALTAMINISGADCTIRNCEIVTADGTNQAVLGILTTAGADRLTLDNNFIHGSLNAGTTTQISLVGGADIRIINNIIRGACTTSAGNIANATTDSTDLIIANNFIANTTASSTKNIVLTATSTGHVVNNRLAVFSGTAPVTAAAMMMGGNVYVAAAGVTAGTASTF